MDVFEGESMQTQYFVLGYKINLHFHYYKLAIEVDEFNHCDVNIDNEIKRLKVIKEELDFKFFRINSDEHIFNIFKAINKMHSHIKESSKRFLMDRI